MFSWNYYSTKTLTIPNILVTTYEITSLASEVKMHLLQKGNIMTNQKINDEEDNLTWDQRFALAKNSLEKGREKFLATIKRVGNVIIPNDYIPPKHKKKPGSNKGTGRYCRCADGGTPTIDRPKFCDNCKRQLSIRITDLPGLSSRFSEINNISAQRIVFHTTRKYFWKCASCPDNWYGSPQSALTYTQCPKCRPKKKTIVKVSHSPRLKSEYSTKNSEPANAVSSDSQDLYWWDCSSCKKSYRETPYNRKYNNTGCQSCGFVAYQQLLDRHDLLLEYSDRNEYKPHELRNNYDKPVLWRCLKNKGHKDYKMKIKTRLVSNGCPECLRAIIIKPKIKKSGPLAPRT